jgi:hypothetical protein
MRLMVLLGYLDTGYLVGRTPKYYIEVKYTTGDCATPLIVSQNQVDLVSVLQEGFKDND